MKRPKQPRSSSGPAIDRMVDMVDTVRQFQQWRSEFLPAIQKDLLDGKLPKELFEKYKAMAAARLIMNVLAPDAKDAHQAAKEILDRTEGRPAEKVKHTHALAELSEKELDALLLSESKDLANLGKNDK